MTGANWHSPWCQGELAGRGGAWGEGESQTHPAWQKTHCSQASKIVREAKMPDFNVDSHNFKKVVKIWIENSMRSNSV